MNSDFDSPPARLTIPVEDDLRQRLDFYVTVCDVNRDILLRRLLNDSLRELLNKHAPIIYPCVGQDA